MRARSGHASTETRHLTCREHRLQTNSAISLRFALASLACVVSLAIGCAADVAQSPQATEESGTVIQSPAGPPKLTARGAPVASPDESAAPLPPGTSSAGASTGTAPQSYIIQPGDQVEVRFLYHPYFNTTVPVRPDGKITLQMVHDVQAAGLTPMQLWYYLTKRYEALLDREDITVTMKSFATTAKTQSVYVGGEVPLAKVLELTPGMTVLQAIYAAGGLRESANTETILVLRRLYAAQHEVLTVNVEDVLEGRVSDVTLEDRDVVYIPKTAIAKANQYVDQYLNRIVPRWVTSAFAFTYPIGTIQTEATVIPNTQ